MDLPHDVRALLPEFGPAAHVHCLQQRLRSERIARHWHDLAQLERTGFAEGALVLVPEGDVRTRLAEDYHRMLSSGLLPTGVARFDEVLDVCRTIEGRANR